MTKNKSQKPEQTRKQTTNSGPTPAPQKTPKQASEQPDSTLPAGSDTKSQHETKPPKQQSSKSAIKQSTKPTNKKPAKKSKAQSEYHRINKEFVRQQKQAIDMLTEEILDYHEMSMIDMLDSGILPPLYGGDYLGDEPEATPLWAVIDEQETPELGAILLRVMPDVEPVQELQNERDEIGLSNDWPVSELLDIMVTPDGKPVIEDSDSMRDLMMLFVLFGQQVKAAPGYDYDQMLLHMAASEPFAIFVKIPTAGEGENMTYLWEDIEHYSAEVVYADSPQLLQAAVWEYRLNLAIQAEKVSLVEDREDPNEVMLGQSTADFGALYEILVIDTLRFYGTTSAIRAKQAELDILRTEEGDLVIKAPLKASVEPLPILAENREVFSEALLEDYAQNGIRANTPDSVAKSAINDSAGEILRLGADSDVMRQIWPTIRAHNFFLIRHRRGRYMPDKTGKLIIQGFMETPLLEWYMAESLPELYVTARLISIYEMLSGLEIVEGKVRSYE